MENKRNKRRTKNKRNEINEKEKPAKLINILELIDESILNRENTLNYINKLKKDIFVSNNETDILDAYVLFRGETLDDLLCRNTIQPEYNKLLNSKNKILKYYKHRIKKLPKSNHSNTLIYKLIWEEQNLLCSRTRNIRNVEDGVLVKSKKVNNKFTGDNGVVIIKYILDNGFLIEGDAKNGLIVMKIHNIEE
ncbi:hypothetical protein CDIK_1995 [Cucumispora dikerogammari]|nr:hypothetical protein CDIK_1995 [Cucumispora dikerogammari]